MALEIRTYVVLDAEGKILGIKLNRTSAMDLHKANRGSYIEPHMADKKLGAAQNTKDVTNA